MYFTGLAGVIRAQRSAKRANLIARGGRRWQRDRAAGASARGGRFRDNGKIEISHGTLFRARTSWPVRASAAKCLLLVNELTRRNARARAREKRQ